MSKHLLSGVPEVDLGSSGGKLLVGVCTHGIGDPPRLLVGWWGGGRGKR